MENWKRRRIGKKKVEAIFSESGRDLGILPARDLGLFDFGL